MSRPATAKGELLPAVVPDGTGALTAAPAAFGVEGVESTRTGLRFHDPNLPYEAWEHIGFELGAVRDWSAWAIGDWMLAGEALYGEERVDQGIEVTGRSKVTLLEYERVARKVPPSRRRESLSFTHHQLVAARPAAEQGRCLDEAEANHWSVEEFRGMLEGDRRALSTRRDEAEDALTAAARAVVEESVPRGAVYLTPRELIDALREAVDS